MAFSENRNNPEFPEKKYAEDIFERLPEVEIGRDIPRVYPTQLSGGKDTKLTISVEDRLAREGWDLKQVQNAQVGSLLIHRNGDVYQVTGMNHRQRRLDIRNTEQGGIEGAIIAKPYTLKAHLYEYRLTDQQRHSKKIKVYDTVIKKRDLRTEEFINEILRSIPAVCMEVFDEIQIHTQHLYAGKFKAEPSLGPSKRVITLYISEDYRFLEDGEYPAKGAIETMYHELWHAIVKYLKGSANPGEEWRTAMRASDRPVSKYAEKTRYHGQDDQLGEIEDIADSGMMYFATDGANTDQIRQLREFTSPRFEKLDAVLRQLRKRQEMGKVAKILHRPSRLT